MSSNLPSRISPQIELHPTTEADLDFVLAAETAPENACFVRQWSRDRHRQACQDPDERHWIIWHPDTQQPVGYTLLLGVQDPDQCLLIKRIVVTEKGQGFGRATLQRVLTIAFQDLNAHRVWLDVMANNDRARSLYQRLGFVEEGKLRECVKTPQGFRSMYIMAMLRSEFPQHAALWNSPSTPV